MQRADGVSGITIENEFNNTCLSRSHFEKKLQFDLIDMSNYEACYKVG